MMYRVLFAVGLAIMAYGLVDVQANEETALGKLIRMRRGVRVPHTVDHDKKGEKACEGKGVFNHRFNKCCPLGTIATSTDCMSIIPKTVCKKGFVFLPSYHSCVKDTNYAAKKEDAKPVLNRTEKKYLKKKVLKSPAPGKPVAPVKPGAHVFVHAKPAAKPAKKAKVVKPVIKGGKPAMMTASAANGAMKPAVTAPVAKGGKPAVTAPVPKGGKPAKVAPIVKGGSAPALGDKEKDDIRMHQMDQERKRMVSAAIKWKQANVKGHSHVKRKWGTWK